MEVAMHSLAISRVPADPPIMLSALAGKTEPGESQTLILPFKVNKNALKDQNSFDELDPSDFCIQMVDFSSSTAYRLWL